MNTSEIQAKIKKESEWAQGAFMATGVIFAVVAVLMLALYVWATLTKGEGAISPGSAVLLYNLIFISVISIFTAKVFRELRRGYTPFSAKTTKGIRHIAYIMYVMAVSPSAVDLIIALLKLDLERVGETNYFVGFLGLVLATIFLMLARIFEYGRLLQQESDETL
jgi:hypothetical protein